MEEHIEEITNVTCAECDKVLDETFIPHENQMIPCPVCGCIIRNVEVTIKEEFHLYETFGIKSKEKGFKKPRQEIVQGHDLYVTKNKWVKKYRLIDRKNDKYIEEIYEDGKIIHHCNESLSEHFGHGSAKFKYKK